MKTTSADQRKADIAAIFQRARQDRTQAKSHRRKIIVSPFETILQGAGSLASIAPTMPTRRWAIRLSRFADDRAALARDVQMVGSDFWKGLAEQLEQAEV